MVRGNVDINYFNQLFCHFCDLQRREIFQSPVQCGMEILKVNHKSFLHKSESKVNASSLKLST